MSHDDFDDFLFVKKQMVLIDKEGDEEGIFETTSQVEEEAAPRIINIYQDIERASRLECNIENLPSVLTGGRTINSEDVLEFWNIVIVMVENNDPLEENIHSVGAPVNEGGGGVYDGQIWGDDGIYPSEAANHHRSGQKIPSDGPSIVTNLTILEYFLILFTMDSFRVTILPGMNRSLPERDTHVSEHEFTKWFKMWLVMGCYKGNWGWKYWWSKDDI